MQKQQRLHGFPIEFYQIAARVGPYMDRTVLFVVYWSLNIKIVIAVKMLRGRFRISQNEERKKHSNEQSIGMPYFYSDNSKKKTQLTTHSAVCVISIRICANIVRKKMKSKNSTPKLNAGKSNAKHFEFIHCNACIPARI